MRFQDGGKRQTVIYIWLRGEHCNFRPISGHLARAYNNDRKNYSLDMNPNLLRVYNSNGVNSDTL
jgi:hypothetical protein